MVNLISIVSTRGLPAITVSLGEVTTLALLDSASGLNLIKKGVFDSCTMDRSLVRESEIRVKGVNGVISKAIGEVNLWVEIMDREFKFLFVIIDHAEFPTDVLLGIEALRRSKLVTDWNSNRVWFSDAIDHAKQYENVAHLSAQVECVGVVPNSTGMTSQGLDELQGLLGSVCVCEANTVYLSNFRCNSNE